MTDIALAPARGQALDRLLRLPSGVVGLTVTLSVAVVALLAAQVAPYDPHDPVAEPLSPPSWAHPFGSDDLGRDVLSGVVHGARTSMVVVGVSVILALALGVAVGALSGYRGGLLDDALMRVTDLFQSVPRFFLAILVVALLGPGLRNLALVLGITSFPMLARVVRAETLTLRGQDFVEAARSVGASDGRILVRHVLPGVLPALMVVVSLLAARVIILETSLGFIGLGDPNAISWGYLVNNAQRFLRVAWWMSVFPGVAIILAVLGLNLLGDAITESRQPGGVTAGATGLPSGTRDVGD